MTNRQQFARISRLLIERLDLERRESPSPDCLSDARLITLRDGGALSFEERGHFSSCLLCLNAYVRLRARIASVHAGQSV
jgi:hypothetical protein